MKMAQLTVNDGVTLRKLFKGRAVQVDPIKHTL